MVDQPVERSETSPYRVLARKYRPATFADLIGQEALVRTLRNAIATGRLAHAFVLTGVRGVGKTTTARIIARALNCIGVDGQGGPTIEPCGVCAHCRDIAQDRHVDVIEMDAASRTGVGDIRELIESVRYRPVQARYKIYVIDEVHMLSTAAFNALLKTLEEPPEQVIFVFATTEIRKIPITVLSRCQRFDLRRVDQATLIAHFTAISEKEGVVAAPEAIAMIARAADGSVRDGLSLLDQAIALGGGAEVTVPQVGDMLGLADRARIFDLFDALMAGGIGETLRIFGDLYAAGADPAVVVQDLLELTHFLTRAKIEPKAFDEQPEIERVRGREISEKLSLASLARCWQILLKGLGETRTAPVPSQAAEMLLIRLAYASELPSPGDLVKQLTGESGAAQQAAPATSPTPDAPSAAASSTAASPTAGPSSGTMISQAEVPGQDMAAPPAGNTPRAATAAQTAAQTAVQPTLRALPVELREPVVEEAALPNGPQNSGLQDNDPQSNDPRSLAEVVELARRYKHMSLANHLMEDIHLVNFEAGRIEFRPGERAAPRLAGDLSHFLQEATGRRWMVSLSRESGEPPLRERERKREAARREEAMDHPLVRAALETFPGAKLVARRDTRPAGEPPAYLDDPEDPGAEPDARGLDPDSQDFASDPVR